MLSQAQSSEAFPAAVGACPLHSHLFSSAALGTTEPVHEPTPSTSYLAADDGVCIAVQSVWPLLLMVRKGGHAGAVLHTCYHVQADLSDINLTPREVVERLDKYIVGQVSIQYQCCSYCCSVE